MRTHKAVLFAGVAFAATSVAALAQDIRSVAGADEAVASESGADIVVTARRRNESLQDVPQTVNVVTSESIEKLRIFSAGDVASVVPGISIESSSAGSGGFGQSQGIRGVPTFQTANASPTVQFYLNDAPASTGLTSLLYDVGQIEVLKGPQGTLRGRSAPTGAITFTTKRADLNELGGTIILSGTTLDAINGQAAIGIPLVKDVLAVRVAGSLNHTEGNGVKSANSRLDPSFKAEGLRGSVRFEPGSNFTANVMYQRYWQKSRSFSQVTGLGNTIAANGPNGPAIRPGDRLGITDGASTGNSKIDYVVGQAEWRFGGQKLTYVGAYRDESLISVSAQDGANVIHGIEYFQNVNNASTEQTHELRLASEDRVLGIFDYVIGGFYNKTTGRSNVLNPARFLTGAFGRPGTTPTPQVDPLARYTLNTAILIDNGSTEKSLFGNVTAHIGENTELSVGGRYIDFNRRDKFSIDTLGAFNAVRVPSCAFVPGSAPSTVYTGDPLVCDLPIAGSNIQTVDRSAKYTPFLYNVSLSHKFTPDFMVYGNVGSAFRSAGPRIGFTSPIVCCTASGGPALAPIDDLVFQREENSKSYEIGFKAALADSRVRFNVSLFQQDYDNFYFQTQPVQYLSITNPANPLAANGASISNSEFTVGGKARVRGVDIDAAFQVTSRWSVNLAMTYSKAKLNNALVPCNDSNFDGSPDIGVPTVAQFVSNGLIVARCRSNDAISRTPTWNLNVQSEYSVPVSNSTEGFIRGNFNYYPDNPNASQGIVIDKYSLLNMYAGLRAENGAWEVTIFANNLLNNQQLLSFNQVAPTSSAAAGAFPQPGGPGYNAISYTPRREFGLQVRFAIGSR
jgi:iron complex outermembrane recepter protein